MAKYQVGVAPSGRLTSQAETVEVDGGRIDQALQAGLCLATMAGPMQAKGVHGL